MIKDKQSFLNKLALAPEMEGNKVSLVFALNSAIDISSKEQFASTIEPFIKSVKEESRQEIIPPEEDTPTVVDEWAGKDLRIRKVKLKSVRGFPESNLPFGVNFSDEEGAPQSMILLGANGAGKSSIFDAIEYTYCRKIGEAQLRTAKTLRAEDDFFKQYLSHYSQPFSNSFCEVETGHKPLTLHHDDEKIPEEVRRKINPDSHFISDYDIYYNGQLSYSEGGDKSFHHLIAESLGLSELLEFQKKLKVFLAYRRRTESGKINNLEKSIKKEEDIIAGNEKLLAEKKATLKSAPTGDTKSKQKAKQLNDILIKLQSQNHSFYFDTNGFENGLKSFKEAYTKFSALETSGSAVSSLQFLQSGLELLQSSSDCPFCESSKKGLDDIKSHVEGKIEQLKSQNQITQELNRTRVLLIDHLQNYFNSLALFKEGLSREFNTINGLGEFSALASLLNHWLSTVESEMAEEYFTQWSTMNEAGELDHLKVFARYVEMNASYWSEKLRPFTASFKSFSAERSKTLENLKTRLTDKPERAEELKMASDNAIINREIESTETQIKDSQRKIESYKVELTKFRNLKATFDEIKREVGDYSQHFDLLLNKEVNEAYEPVKGVVEDVLKTYLTREERKVELKIEMIPGETDKETGEVLSEIITASITPHGQSTAISVNKYFNTFHYRLFATMVGIGVAIASRIKTQINLPLVLDDIFYASDFENRATVERFIKSLFTIFNKHTADLPLQLILFTHDQLIFESAVKATAESKIEEVAFAKLFPFTDAKPQDDYRELAYHMPTYLPFQIMQNTLVEA